MARKRIWVLTVCIALILVGAFVCRYMSRNIYFQGIFIPKDALQADLRGKELTLQDFDTLQSQLPDCQILWNVPFQGKMLSSNITSLQVDTLSEEDLFLLDYFPHLSTLDALDCTDYAQLFAYQTSHPDCNVVYQVELGGTAYSKDVTVILLENPDFQELQEKLRYLPHMMWLRLSGILPDAAQLEQLRNDYPSIDIQWELSFQGQIFSTTEPVMDLTQHTLDYDSALELHRWFPDTTKVDMRGCGLSDEEMMALADAYPDRHFIWDMTIGKFQYPTDAVELDISGHVMESTREIEDLLPYFPNVRKIIMSHCGFDDATMDELNNRYPNIRFVWSVKIKDVYLRTDATYFYPFKFYRTMTVNNKDLYPLRYCTDLVCIDIGHMGEVTDCEWAAFMPNLKYLIIGETAISDLTPLSGLKNLVYLEMFTVPVTDYSPLVGCTGLEDLNLGKTYGSPEPIAKMTWLKNLWWCDCMTLGHACSGAKEILDEALPNTTKRYYPAHPTASGWRKLDNYFAMRDYLGMFYLD